MSITAQQVIEGSYNRSSSNDAGKLASDAEVLSHLDRTYQRLWALVARARPHEFASATSLPLGSVPPTLALPANLVDLLDVRTVAGATVHVIPYKDRTRRWTIPPAVYRLGQSLVSRNAAGDPIVADSLTLTILDAPVALTALSSVLDGRWPSRHYQVLVDELAVYLSVKDSGRSAAERAAIDGALKESGAALAAEYALGPSALEWLHAPAERSVPAGKA